MRATTNGVLRMDNAGRWHSMRVEEVLTELGATNSGLGGDDAALRLPQFGRNELPRGKETGLIAPMVAQLKNPLALVLLGAAFLTGLLGRGSDAVVITAVVAINALIGGLQEFRAARAIQALDTLVPENTNVLRDGFTTVIPVAEVVPGDVVLLEAGDRVPADLRVMTERSLRVNESALTGEASAVAKQDEPVAQGAALADRSSMLFSGSFVVGGTGRGVAVATGPSSELGRISELLHSTKAPETPLTRKLRRLGNRLTQIICAVSLVIFYVAFRRGFPLLGSIRAGVAFACAAIPVGLPAVFTIALAVAVRRMADRNAVVRTLPAVETLGSTNIICSDKTGTLTTGEMTVRHLWTPFDLYDMTGTGYAPVGELRQRGTTIKSPPPLVSELLRGGALCSDAAIRMHEGRWTGLGDPTEVALVAAAEKIGVPVPDTRNGSPRRDAIPFDPAVKYMATLHDEPEGQQIIIVKGAPEVLLRFCSKLAGAETFEPGRVLEIVDLMAASGMRVLALASRRPEQKMEHLTPDDLNGFTFLGLVGSADPPRPEAIQAITVCHLAGIRVKMITGDHPETARAVGGEMGIASGRRRVVQGPEIGGMSARELKAAIAETDLFARVEPEHKLMLVKALQGEGGVIAMTGDGVNDAPALRQADVGVAMGKTGTAVAREASDIVLVDDNFASIAAAVQEGRHCYDNLRKALMFLLPTNIGQSLVVLAGALFFPIEEGVPLLPLIPIQVLWVNLVTGVTLALPLAFEPEEKHLMEDPPRPYDEPIVGAYLTARTIIVGLTIAAGSVALFLTEYMVARASIHATREVSLERAQTMVATTVVLFQTFYLFQCRSLGRSPFERGRPTNRAVWIGVIVTLVLQAGFVHLPVMNLLFHSAPLGPREWAASALAAATVLPVAALHQALRKTPKH